MVFFSILIAFCNTNKVGTFLRGYKVVELDTPKGYLCFRMITSQNVSSEVQIKDFFISWKNYVSSQDIQIFVFLTIPWFTEYLLHHDEYQYIRQSTFSNISFEPQLIKSPNLANW